LAVVAAIAVVAVGVRAWIDAAAAPPGRGAAPVCATPVEVVGDRGVRLGCANEAELSECPEARAGDRVVAATCRVEPAAMSAAARLLSGLPLDINRASTGDLELLGGIGPVRAKAIAAERDKGPFASVEDLLRVRGIGPATLARVRPFVTVVP
jgi:competence ComEA-like helix-hairpin-helix protein